MCLNIYNKIWYFVRLTSASKPQISFPVDLMLVHKIWSKQYEYLLHELILKLHLFNSVQKSTWKLRYEFNEMQINVT